MATPVGSGAYAAEWPVWSTTARLVVTDAGALGEARAIVDADLAAVDLAASRFRADSEVSRLHIAGGRPLRVGVAPVAPAVAGWRRVRLDGRTLTVPPDVLLDLGATAKAHAADRCAARVAGTLGTGVLVSLGGDIATAGPAPDGGWKVLVRDRPGDPACTVAIPAGAAVATSSTASRRWRHGGRAMHHVLDPRTCRPATPVWRSATVAARRAVAANTLTTAALVRGTAAVDWLRARGLPARLVAADGSVTTLGGWPDGSAGGAR